MLARIHVIIYALGTKVSTEPIVPLAVWLCVELFFPFPPEVAASGSAAHRFLIDIHEAVITRLNEAGDRLMVESWHPARCYRRLERA